MRAINHVAVALNSRAYVEKIERCSTRGSVGADLLSKGDYTKFRELFPEAEDLPRPIPEAVKWWINNPRADDELGRKICLELRAKGVKVLDSMC